MEILFLVGRIILGGFFLMTGVNHFMKKNDLVSYGKQKGVPLAEIMVPITGLMMFLGGLGVIVGAYVLISITLLVLFMIPTTFIMHAFWKEDDEQKKMNEMMNFMKNMAIIGALFMLYQLGEVWAYSLSL